MSLPVDTTHDELRSAMRKAAAEFPYPVASICRRHVETGAADPRSEWLDLVREPFHAVIHYLAHLLLAEIAACGLRPPHLFHRIVRVLGNGSEGEFVGFLREGSAFMRDHRERMLMVELLDLAGNDKGVEPDSANLLPCLHRLVELRNAIAHGDLPERVLRVGVAEVRERIAELLRGVEWITRYPLRTADGMELMGAELPGRLATSEPLGLSCGDGMNLRPLLLALDGGRIGLLQRYDSDPPRLVFRGTDGLITYSRKELAGERLSGVFDEVRALLAAVRSVEAPLNRYHWETFSERASLHTGRTLAEYSDEASGKYHPEQYVPRAGWEGQDGEWQRFLESPKSVLALSSEQGGGKSALAARLAGLAAEDGHAVFFIDAFQLGFVREPRLSENPLPGHWAEMMNFTRSFDPRALKSVLRGAPASKVVVFVLDSNNEIDAFGSRWNRFRVMDCLLEWACAMAGPRFKVLLTFRASEFTEYGFLSDADLPPRLREVAWTREEMDDSENWIRELQPMRPEDAERMLGRLWETRDPLAPRFSWQALEHALGGKIHEFTSNPLLFRVFLHAHAGREEIETIDREVLFERYAESLTGAAERRTAPLPLRAWYWLRDGNITRHERFLADLLTCMSRAGNSHLLSHLIDAKAKGAQRNVAREWNAPDSQILRRLGQGGMIREEAMEIRLPGGGVKQVRKLSLVAELTANCLGKIQSKILGRKYTKMRFNTFSHVIAFILIFWVVFKFLEVGISIISISQIYGHYANYLMLNYNEIKELTFLFLCALSSFHLYNVINPAALPKNVFLKGDYSLSEQSFYQACEEKGFKNMMDVMPFSILASAFIVCAISILGDMQNPQGMWHPSRILPHFLPAIGSIVAFIIITSLSSRFIGLLRIPEKDLPMGYSVYTMKRLSQGILPQRHDAKYCLKSITAFIICAILAFSCLFLAFQRLPSDHDIISLTEWENHSLKIDFARSAHAWRASIWMIPLFYMILFLAMSFGKKMIPRTQWRSQKFSASMIQCKWSDDFLKILQMGPALVFCLLVSGLTLLIDFDFFRDSKFIQSMPGGRSSHAKVVFLSDKHYFPDQSVAKTLSNKSLKRTMVDYPFLRYVSISDDNQQLKSADLSRLRSFVIIEVNSDEPPRLDWITDQVGDHPIRLTKAPDAGTRLGVLTKLILPVDTDLSLLKTAGGLRWLHIDQVAEIPDAGWFEALRQVIEGHLPHLETLEISAGDAVWFDSESGSFMTSRFPGGVAYGRENILNLLQGLIEAPERLENPQHTIRDEDDIYLLPNDD